MGKKKGKKQPQRTPGGKSQQSTPKQKPPEQQQQQQQPKGKKQPKVNPEGESQSSTSQQKPPEQQQQQQQQPKGKKQPQVNPKGESQSSTSQQKPSEQQQQQQQQPKGKKQPQVNPKGESQSSTSQQKPSEQQQQQQQQPKGGKKQKREQSTESREGSQSSEMGLDKDFPQLGGRHPQKAPPRGVPLKQEDQRKQPHALLPQSAKSTQQQKQRESSEENDKQIISPPYGPPVHSAWGQKRVVNEQSQQQQGPYTGQPQQQKQRESSEGNDKQIISPPYGPPVHSAWGQKRAVNQQSQQLQGPFTGQPQQQKQRESSEGNDKQIISPPSGPPVHSAWGQKRAVNQQSQQQQGTYAGPPQQQQGPRGPPQKQQGPRGPPQQQRGPSASPPQPSTSSRAPSMEVQLASQKQLVSDISKVSISSKSSNILIPKRKNPLKGGVLGRKLKIYANHFEIDFSKLKTRDVWHYDVDLEPDKPKKFLKRAFEEFRIKHFPKNYPAFDGKKNLYAAGQLPFNTEISDTISIIDDNGKQIEYRVTVKETKEIIDFEILKYTPNTFDSKNVNIKPAIAALDVILRTVPSSQYTQVGRSFFSPPKKGIIRLGDGMEMWYGFYQSVTPGWKVHLNVDVAHKAFPSVRNLKLSYDDFCGRGSNPRDVEKFQKFVKGLKIEYGIPDIKDYKRVYIVNGFALPARDQKFRLESGEEMTIESYFKEKRYYSVKHPTRYPCIKVGDKNRKNPIILPMELCDIIHGQALNRKMNEYQTSKMINYAATSTDDRKKKIIDGMRGVNFYKDHPCVNDFGVSVGTNFVNLEARILSPPQIEYNDKRIEIPKSGQWRLNSFINPCGDIKEWAILNLVGTSLNAHIKYLAASLKKTGDRHGVFFRNNPEIEEHDRPPVNEKDKIKIKEFFDKCKHNNYQIIIVIIPDKGDVYGKVKQAAELQSGVITQCIRQRTIQKLSDSTVTNLLLKINSKMNGSNHHLNIKTRPSCLNTPTMLVGADVAHPSPDSKDIPSVAAVASSHDPNGYCYNIQYRLQPPTREIIDDLGQIIKDQLKLFYRKNRCQKPQRIIFYRDGVSEGQFDEVLRMELYAIQNACSQLEKGYCPAITFVVVQKRHHTRLFPQINSECSNDELRNVPAGTIVDTTITHPTDMDFYLVSHASLKGVSKPTKYRLLYDDTNFSDDEIQELTFSLCHMFSRCTRSVSYPTPTYYAHLAAARARVYLEGSTINLDRLAIEQQSRTIKEEVISNFPMFFV